MSHQYEAVPTDLGSNAASRPVETLQAAHGRGFLERAVKFSIVAILSVAVLFVAVVVINDSSTSPNQNTEISLESQTTHLFTLDRIHRMGKVDGNFTLETCGCDEQLESLNCTDRSYPVMGGLDPVQYFSFPDDTYVGVAGSKHYPYTYEGYRYYFISEENQLLFASDPDRYRPQWGGFCSWGMAAEYCSDFLWSSTCLGPSGNWDIWTIQTDPADGKTKLYFFYLEEVKESFLKDTDFYINQGNARWSAWFGSGDPSMNTQCYFKADEESWDEIPVWMNSEGHDKYVDEIDWKKDENGNGRN